MMKVPERSMFFQRRKRIGCALVKRPDDLDSPVTVHTVVIAQEGGFVHTFGHQLPNSYDQDLIHEGRIARRPIFPVAISKAEIDGGNRAAGTPAHRDPARGILSGTPPRCRGSDVRRKMSAGTVGCQLRFI